MVAPDITYLPEIGHIRTLDYSSGVKSINVYQLGIGATLAALFITACPGTIDNPHVFLLHGQNPTGGNVAVGGQGGSGGNGGNGSGGTGAATSASPAGGGGATASGSPAGGLGGAGGVGGSVTGGGG
jgi:hypothetical protein